MGKPIFALTLEEARAELLRAASKSIRREHKRKVLVFASGYRSHHKYYLDRGGVETLAILYGQQPRAEIMASLRGP